MFGVRRHVEREYSKKCNKAMLAVFVVAVICALIF